MILHISVEEEAERRHSKRRTPTRKMKVDQEEENLLHKSRKLRNLRSIKPNQKTIIKLKTRTKMIHNSSLPANLKT